MKEKKKTRLTFRLKNIPMIKRGYSWGGNTPLWEEESEELTDELEELRERSRG